MPRSFSSCRRSGSMPVSARMSVDLPWSTWPAVPMTLMPDRSNRLGERSVLLGEHRPQVEQHPSRPRCARRPASGRGASEPRGRPRNRRSSATAQLGCVWPGSEPPPMADRVSTTSPPSRAASARARASRSRRRGADHAPDRHLALGLAAHVVHQRGAERRQRQLVRANRAHQRVPSQASRSRSRGRR